uniref:Transglutaminase-like domain-containing protein n=1 Tax=Ciona intestinalis TaxID=7719 RepID=H2XMN3_CIOIN
AGIHCKQISGYLKGVGYQPDYKFRGKDDPFRGSWNGVLVDGQWRLIDTHWGARHVTEDDEIASNNWRTEYKYEEHYFLTDPDQLIATHFPDEPEWQLLPKVYSLTDFEVGCLIMNTPRITLLFCSLLPSCGHYFTN